MSARSLTRSQPVPDGILVVLAMGLVLVLASKSEAQHVKLAEIDIPLLGVSANVEPANPVIPKNVASAVRVVLRSGTQELSPVDAGKFIGVGSAAKAELAGPGLGHTITLLPDSSSSDPLFLPIPPLSVAGDYTLSNIRIVSATGESVLDVSPRSVTIKVFDQILITSVQTRPLTLEEIREKGI